MLESDDSDDAAETPFVEQNPALAGATSVALWAAGLTWLVSTGAIHSLLCRLVSPKRLHPFERLHLRGQMALTGSRVRTHVDAAIDPARPYFFLQNHTNHFDHCVAYCATPHFKQGVQLEELFEIPFYGGLMRRRGGIPVSRGSVSGYRHLRERIQAEYAAGHSILGFPEGTRSTNGRLGTLQPGLFRIAQELEAPIVPVTVTGLYRVMRRGSWIISPGHTITVHYDAPVETRGSSRRDLPQLMREVGATMRGHLDRHVSAPSPVADSGWLGASRRVA